MSVNYAEQCGSCGAVVPETDEWCLCEECHGNRMSQLEAALKESIRIYRAGIASPDVAQRWMKMVEGVIDGRTSPVVKLPRMKGTETFHDGCMDVSDVKAALDAAGVKWEDS